MKSDSDEKLQQLLAALFDGEPAGAQGESLRKELLGSSSELASEWESLKSVRAGVRDWHGALRRSAEGRERPVDLWARIASDIRREGIEPAGAPSLVSRFMEQAREFFAMPAVMASFAVLAVGIFSVLRSPEAPMVLQQVASYPVVSSSSQAALVRVSEGREVAPLSLPDAMAAAYKSEIMRSRSGRMVPVLPTSDKDFVLGGLRSHGADIDWVKSDKPVKILPLHGEHGAPPIIWVARRNPAIDAYAGLD